MEREAQEVQFNLGSLFGMAAAAILGTTLTIWIWHFANLGGEARPKQPEPGAPPKIAVLPFRSLSGNSDDRRIEDSLTEGVTRSLGRLKRLEIVPLNGDTDPAAVGRELGAKAMIIGLVERQGGRVRVKVQIVSGSDGRQIWAGGFNGDENDLEDVNRLISQTVAKYLTALLD